MADKPPILVDFGIDQASALVGTAYRDFSGFALESFATAQDAIRAMGNVVTTPVRYNAVFDPQMALAQFPAIPAPNAPNIALGNVELPPAPPGPAQLHFETSAAPEDTTIAPVFIAPQRPTLVALTDPGAAPALKEPALPSAPALEMPALPPGVALDLPVPPNITLPAFAGVRPQFNAPVPDENFSFEAQAYVSALLDKTRATISRMMDGGTGLPAAVAKALRDRATTAADNEVTRATEEAVDQFAARGFDEPNGVLGRRLARVAQEGMVQRAGVNRDVYVQDQTVAVENLRFAVQQGIALESTLMQLHQQMAQLALESAKYAVDIAVSILNARIAVFNAQMNAYQTDAQVFRDLIGAETARLDLYRAQLEGEKLKADINESQLRRYEAQLRGVNMLVELYKSQLSAVEVESQINVQRIDQFRARVSVLTEQVRAQSVQMDGYTAAVNAETAKAKYYETATQGFANRVQAWSAGESAKIEGQKLLLAANANEQEGWKAQVQLFSSQLQAELARIDTVSKSFGAEVEVFKGRASVASAAAEANNRMFQLNLAQQQAVVDTELKRASLDIEQWKFVNTQNAEIKKGIAQVSGQVASASLSAVNFSAGTTWSAGARHDYNLGISYSGSMDDATP